MTTPNGPILLDSSTGSDTAASGLGPATAVTGTGASTTSASAVVTGIDTTGVTAGDLLWVSTSTGRKFSIVATVDSGTQVTCDDTFGVTASGQTWAIGGKRASLGGSSVLLSNDAIAGWIIELADGHTETIASTITWSAVGTSASPVILRGASGASVKPIVTFSNNGVGIDGSATSSWYVEINDIEFRNSNATKTASYAVYTGNSYYRLSRLTISHATNKFWRGIRGPNSGLLTPKHIVFCEVANCADMGMFIQSDSVMLFGNYIHDNGGDGVDGNRNNWKLLYNVVADNTGIGIDVPGVSSLIGNVFDGNSDDGIECTTVELRYGNVYIRNGGFGLQASSIGGGEFSNFDSFGSGTVANTSGPSDGILTGVNDITLTADPFVDAAAGDFNINNTAGGGALLRAATLEVGQ